MRGRCDVVLTLDRRFTAQGPIPARLAVILIRPRSNKLRDIVSFAPRILSELAAPRRGEVVVLEP